MAKKNSYNKYIDIAGKYFELLPSLSKGAQKSLVGIVPWIALIFGILGVSVAVVGFGIFTIIEPITQITGVKKTGFDFIFVLFSFITSALLLSAFPGTQKREKKGWMLLYFSEVVSFISDLISKDTGGILLSLIFFYLLYQIRGYYTK